MTLCILALGIAMAVEFDSSFVSMYGTWVFLFLCY